MLLRDLHFDCVEAANGIEALKLSSDNGIDLIVVALEMPRMDGIEFIGIVERGAFGDTPPPAIVCADALQLKGARSKFEFAHAVVLLASPLEPDSFSSAVSTAFRGRHGPTAE